MFCHGAVLIAQLTISANFRDPQLVKVQSKETVECSVPRGECISHFLIEEDEAGRLWEPEAVDNATKPFSYHKRTVTHMNSQLLWTACMRPVQAQTKQNASTEGGHKVSPLDEELLATDSCWKGEPVFFTGVAPGRWPCSTGRSHIQEDAGSTNWTLWVSFY